MAKRSGTTDFFLQWTEQVPTADVQDPLGTSLRGSTRLANQLLYCITSITPRARYFSFIPWCVYDYKKREKNQSYAPGLRQGIQYREHALTLGCVVHHDKRPCDGGALVGSNKAVEWYSTEDQSQIDFKNTNFVDTPALDAYFSSLVNLGVFITEEELPELSDEEEPPRMTFDDVELTDLGKELALRYESIIGELKSVSEVASRKRLCTVSSLKSWGEKGGLCELSSPKAPDRQLLLDLFLCRNEMKGESHPIRRQTLLLFLNVCQQLNDDGQTFDVSTFSESVYYGVIRTEKEAIEVAIPESLEDVATRWRMFYFHYFIAISLEGIFSWLVTRLYDAGVSGESMSSLVESIDESLVRKAIGELFGLDLNRSFGELSPSELFASFGVPSGPLTAEVSQSLDKLIFSDSKIAECLLEKCIRDRKFTYSSSGFAVSLSLLALTAGRYRQWEETKYGNWLASNIHDPYLDLGPPVVLQSLNRRFGDWWTTPFRELAPFVMSRFIIQQHQSMSLSKSAMGSKCIIQVDGTRICATGNYDKISIGNVRFRTATQVLIDLGLIERDEDHDLFITKNGRKVLKDELAAESKT